MQKIIENIRKYKTAYLISLVVSLVVGVAIFLVFYFVQQGTMVAYLNGTGVSFGALFGIGTLLWLAKAGAFDTLSYGFNQMFTSMFAKEANKYHDLVAYKEDKNQQRRFSANIHYVVWIVSFFFLVAFIVLLIYRSVNY